MKRRYLLGLVAGLLAALLSVTGCRVVNGTYNGLNHGLNGGGVLPHLPHVNEAPAPTGPAPAQPGNPCPGDDGYKTISNEWNCHEGSKWVLVP